MFCPGVLTAICHHQRSSVGFIWNVISVDESTKMLEASKPTCAGSDGLLSLFFRRSSGALAYPIFCSFNAGRIQNLWRDILDSLISNNMRHMMV